MLSAVIPISEAYTGENWDWDMYVEQTAGIEAIAETLSRAANGPGARMLDVGCGYGFGLDLGARLRGWEGIGLDPSPAADAGRAELGIDIRTGLLDADFAPGDMYDVILASELFEHLPDPRSFLYHVHSHLADDGVLLITTPDAAAVEPTTPLTTLRPALSIGHHMFLVDADGLRRALEGAGLVADIVSDGVTLRAVASPTQAGLRQARVDGAPSLAQLAQYCAARANDAPPGSALALGMLGRQVKFTAYDGDFAGAAAAIPALRDALLARHRLDLDDPASIIAQPFVPAVVSSAGYFSGVVAEYVRGDHDEAVALFTASAMAGRHHRAAQKEDSSPEVIAFETKSLGERAIILARHSPEAAPDALRQLDAAAALGACDAATIEDFKRRAEGFLPPRVTRADQARAWITRVKGGVGRRLRRIKP